MKRNGDARDDRQFFDSSNLCKDATRALQARPATRHAVRPVHARGMFLTSRIGAARLDAARRDALQRPPWRRANRAKKNCR